MSGTSVGTSVGISVETSVAISVGTSVGVSVVVSTGVSTGVSIGVSVGVDGRFGLGILVGGGLSSDGDLRLSESSVRVSLVDSGATGSSMGIRRFLGVILVISMWDVEGAELGGFLGFSASFLFLGCFELVLLGGSSARSRESIGVARSRMRLSSASLGSGDDNGLMRLNVVVVGAGCSSSLLELEEMNSRDLNSLRF